VSGPRLRPVNPGSLARPSGYSHGMAAAGGVLLHVAGQVGWDGEGNMVAGGFVAQFDRALANVLAVVAEAGGGPEHVTRMRLYVTDLDEYRRSLTELGAAYRGRMGKRYPAMALVQVAGLLEDGARVEIEADAVVPGAGEP
jgi:enamine deaminase RidA (YjgF/YER057c/UK114 family)